MAMLGRNGIVVVFIACAIGTAAGWFAGRAWGKSKCVNVKVCKCENMEVCKCGNVETVNVGARSPSAPNGRARRPVTADSKPRRKALIRSSADAEVQKRILENEIGYLEKCIAAAKGVDAQPAEKKRETSAEIIERLKKISNKLERWTAFTRLDDKTQSSLMMGDLKKLFPKEMTIDDELSEELAEQLDKMTEVAARRIGILDALDPSALNDEERKVHAEFMDFLAEYPNVFANMIDLPDSMTWGEVHDRIEKMISAVKRGPDLVKKEWEMLIAETVKSFGILDGDAADLRATLDEVRDVTRFMYFEEKD